MKITDSKNIKDILEAPFWIPELKTQSFYTRTHDDTDGNKQEALSVGISVDGDMWVKTVSENFLRFRMPMQGGGLSPRTRNALMILAYAMKLDNEEANGN